MKRKVNRVGQNTLTVSLPSKWAGKYNIQQGDELEVEENGPCLAIGQKIKNLKGSHIDLDITGLDRTSIMLAIRGVYRKGFDNIAIKFDEQTVKHHRIKQDIKALSVIHTEVNRLLGLQIVKEDHNSCLIKDFSANLEQEFDPTIRRIFLLLNNVADDFLKGLKEDDKALISSIEEKHDTVTKFVSYCTRIISKGVLKDDATRQIVLYHILCSLDEIMDIYKYAARDYYPRFVKKVSKDTLAIIEKMNQSFKMFYELFYNTKNSKSYEIIDIRDNIKREIVSLAKSLTKEEILLLNYTEHILEILTDLILANNCL